MGILNSSLPGVGGMPIVLDTVNQMRQQRNRDALTQFQQVKGIYDIKNSQDQMAIEQAMLPYRQKQMEAQAWAMSNPELEKIDQGDSWLLRDRKTGQERKIQKGVNPSIDAQIQEQKRQWGSVSETEKYKAESDERVARIKAASTEATNSLTAATAFRDTSLKIATMMDSDKNVMAYRAALPMFVGAQDALKDKGAASDIDLIYAFGKIMDPNSVVREGELALVTKGQGPIQEKVMEFLRIFKQNGGHLTDSFRQDLFRRMQARMGAMEIGYSAARKRAENLGRASGFYKGREDETGADLWGMGKPTSEQSKAALRDFRKEWKGNAGGGGGGTQYTDPNAPPPGFLSGESP